MPEKKSFTSDCAPKPMATPTTPADAISGATFTPSWSSTASTAHVQITIAATDRPTLPSVFMRCWRRASCARYCGVSSAVGAMNGVRSMP